MPEATAAWESSIEQHAPAGSRASRMVNVREVGREEASLAEPGVLENPAAADALVEANMRFVVATALEYRGRGLDIDDLVGEGTIGLVEAARRFEAARGTKFITYAVWWVRKMMIRAVREQTRLVRLPDHQFRKLQMAGQVPREKTLSLDERGERGTPKVPETRWCSRLPTPEDVTVRGQLIGKITPALERLSEMEQTILAYRFGLAGRPVLSYKQIAARIGLSHERVRQIEAELIVRLRTMIDPGRMSRVRPSRRRTSARARV